MTFNEFQTAYKMADNYSKGRVKQIDINHGQRFMERSIGMLVYKLLSDEDYYRKCKDKFEKTKNNDDEADRTEINYEPFAIYFSEKYGEEKIEFHEGQYFASDAIIDAVTISEAIDDGTLVICNREDYYRKDSDKRDAVLLERFRSNFNQVR